MKRAIYVGKPIEGNGYYVGYGQTGTAKLARGFGDVYDFIPDGSEFPHTILRGSKNLYFPEL